MMTVSISEQSSLTFSIDDILNVPIFVLSLSEVVTLHNQG